MSLIFLQILLVFFKHYNSFSHHKLNGVSVKSEEKSDEWAHYQLYENSHIQRKTCEQIKGQDMKQIKWNEGYQEKMAMLLYLIVSKRTNTNGDKQQSHDHMYSFMARFVFDLVKTHRLWKYGFGLHRFIN